MNNEAFNKSIGDQFKRCEDLLGVKAGEYAADDDRLHNFKVAAGLQGINPKNALAGMMAKHTVSIYDMVNSDVIFSRSMWNEKITDHINYLLLLNAILDEEHGYTVSLEDSVAGLSYIMNKAGG